MAKNETESAKITDIDRMTVSVGVMANIFSLSERRVRQMAEEGIVVRAAKLYAGPETGSRRDECGESGR